MKKLEISKDLEVKNNPKPVSELEALRAENIALKEELDILRGRLFAISFLLPD